MSETKKRKIIIGGKEFQMPQKLSTMAYLRYLEVRDNVMETEKGQKLYTKQQFLDMVDAICEIYDNKFTPEDMLARDTGMSPDEIIMEFAMMDVAVGRRVDNKIARFKQNFSNGK